MRYFYFYAMIEEKRYMEIARKKRDSNKVALAKAILETYQPQTTEDMSNVLKDLFGPMFEAML